MEIINIKLEMIDIIDNNIVSWKVRRATFEKDGDETIVGFGEEGESNYGDVMILGLRELNRRING